MLTMEMESWRKRHGVTWGDRIIRKREARKSTN